MLVVGLRLLVRSDIRMALGGDLGRYCQLCGRSDHCTFLNMGSCARELRGVAIWALLGMMPIAAMLK
jgi:hypothetical protein